MPAAAFSGITADGRWSRSGDVVKWRVPERGGEIRYAVKIDHRRNAGGFDALLTDQWGIFRAEDVFPAATAVYVPGARSRSELLIDLPPAWSAVTPYLPDAAGRLSVATTGRSYSRPLGWLLVGKIGSRMDVIGPTTVRIAAPRSQRIERVPVLALLRWTLPMIQAEIPAPPDYLLLVVGGDPMWRGGLSAPNSLYMHAARPLLSENGTSTLVHELIHVLAPVPTAPEHDWIDEGIAEYLSLVVLDRTGTISHERFADAIETFRRRGASVRTMLTRTAAGAVKARAVVIFHDVDKELRAGRKTADIFDLVRRMMAEGEPIGLSRLREIAAEIAGGSPIRALGRGRVPGSD